MTTILAINHLVVSVADTYVMTVNLPAGDSLSSARLLSPNVTIDAKTGGCLSFIVYFDIYDASLTVTLTNNTASTDFSTLGKINLDVSVFPVCTYNSLLDKCYIVDE